MKKRAAIIAVFCSLLLPAAFAADSTCVKDGQTLPNVKDKKTCKTQGGTWTKAAKQKPAKTPKPGK